MYGRTKETKGKNMNTESNLKSLISLVQKMMDRVGDCTTDSPMIMLNGFDRFCAKVESRKHGMLVGWGDTVEEAFGNLVSRITFALL